MDIATPEKVVEEAKAAAPAAETPKIEVKATVGGVDCARLRSLIERVERLEEEKKYIASDIRDIFSEAKSVGFDVKTMRAVIKLRKMNAADREEQEYMLETYRRALDV